MNSGVLFDNPRMVLIHHQYVSEYVRCCSCTMRHGAHLGSQLSHRIGKLHKIV